MRSSILLALTGIAFSPLVTAIVDGSVADFLEYPFIAVIISKGWAGDSVICAGAVVGVRVGSAYATTGGRLLQVQSILNHPAYSSTTRDNDYGIKQLYEDAVGGGVTAIALPRDGESPESSSGLPVRIAGWGKLSPSDTKMADVLHQATMLTVDESTCNSEWSKVNPLTRSMMCIQADALTLGRSACDMDYGGPIVDELGLTLFGALSYLANDFGKEGCTATPLPNVGVSFSDPTIKSWIKGLII